MVVVGGGAPLCGDSLAGASAVVRPQHAAVANAVGAAVAQVAGSVDAVFDMGGTPASRVAVLQQAERLATERAVRAGAVPASCWTAVREEVPLAYLPGATCRVRVKMIGDLDVDSLASGSSGREEAGTAAEQCAESGQPGVEAERAAAGGAASSPAVAGWPPLPGRGEEPAPAQLAAWRPQLNSLGEWVLHEEDLYLIATGTGILGCGGGGSPARPLLKALMQLQRWERRGEAVAGAACAGLLLLLGPSALFFLQPDMAAACPTCVAGQGWAACAW